MSWNEQAAKYLSGSTTCPRCDRGPVGKDSCPFCGAILTGPVADELRAVSEEAVAVLLRRGEVIGRLPTKAAFAPPPTGAPAPDSPVAAPAAAPAPAGVAAPATVAAPASRTSSQVSLQSVLAIAGAVLVAVAVIVFRFLNVDVDISARRIVVGVVTVVFLGFAWLLARVRLTFSAEAVGALAMVFVGLSIGAIAELVPGDVSPWTFAAVSTLVAALLTLALAAVVRLRTWLWLGLLGLVVVPAFFGYAVDGPWSATVGHLGSVAVALLAFEIATRMRTRFDSPLRADRVTLTLAAATFGAITLIGLPIALPRVDQTGWTLGSALALAVLAGLSALATRTLAAPAWSAALGVLATMAVGILPLAIHLDQAAWWIALLPAAALAGVAALAFVPWPGLIVRKPVRAGSIVVAFVAALPAGMLALAQLATPLMPRGFRWGEPESDLWVQPMSRYGIVEPDPGLAAILGITAAALAALVLAFATRRDGGPVREWTLTAAWLGALAIATIPAWTGFSRPDQIIVGTAVAVAIPLLFLLVPGLRATTAAFRTPFLVAAHVVVAYLALSVWADERVTVAGGAAVVVAIGVLAMAMPAVLRPAYVVVGYAFALLVLLRALDLLGLDFIPALSYTATAASVFALVVTLVRRVRAPMWWAVLGVTAVPFVLGVISVLIERTWETALANAAIFALALTLTLTRRPGITRVVRSTAAALMLPSLAIIVVNIVPRILETGVVPAWNGGGGAPVALPVIAALVALVLPSTQLIADWLRRGDVPEAEVSLAWRWVEISAFVTGGITAFLALVRETSDLGTALVVFVVLGIGAAGAAVFAKRRYGWWAAAASWTAALWCVLGLAGVADAEPYVYPPAVAAVVIGVVLTIRGRNGTALVAPGIAIALLTSLIVLGASGSGPAAVLPWRAIALLAASAVFLVVGVVLDRGRERWKVAELRLPVLLAAIVAAAAGPVQAVRYALGFDRLDGGADAVMPVVLVLSVVAAALAALAGRALRPGHRWALVPALAFLVVGPITATGTETAMWMLWGLSLALLALMIVTVLVARRGPTILAPAWVVFAAAWAVAVAGWSVRDLNVEWFSLPLGLALTAAGALVLRDTPATARRLTEWPVTFSGSWWVLAPGIVVTVLPSVLATGTNPATWRAILVIGLALVALLVGALGRYAAPFVLSLVTFGVELVVILFQLTTGRDIDLVVFYVAAGTAGAILITVAIWFERRSRGDQQTQARMRDLR